ncbi:replication-relaxation family protein [Sinomonas notoginsengisoli]|uniref:replication-relaxation family protein n=1 Tax=Sinomonas notoginsengisoli TaxID=1457311 RepID=UPI001F480E03|nr:replication-relaxation family protein [Sinomonas notoginsengisoli]
MSALDNLPIGYPPASRSEDTSSQVKAKSGRIVAPNTKAAPHPGPHAGNRISHRQLRDIAANLSARDIEVLASVDRYRFLTAGHLRTFHFTAHQTSASAARTCRRVLARLRELRILGVLKRRVGGIRSGSEGMVYYVDAAGDRILREQQLGRRRWRPEEPSARFVDHTLAVADLAVALLQEAEVHDAEVVRLAPEREARRRYTDLLGAPQTLRPDLYVELAEHPGDQDVEAFFIEVDLGHESLPTLLSKCAAYEAYRATGAEQRAYGSYPKVVWAMDAARPETAERRRDSLATTLERSPQFPHGAYVVTALQETAARLMEGYSHG